MESYRPAPQLARLSRPEDPDRGAGGPPRRRRSTTGGGGHHPCLSGLHPRSSRCSKRKPPCPQPKSSSISSSPPPAGPSRERSQVERPADSFSPSLSGFSAPSSEAGWSERFTYRSCTRSSSVGTHFPSYGPFSAESRSSSSDSYSCVRPSTSETGNCVIDGSSGLACHAT
jgi:hypothetical protein